mmetsp:Transcript_2414/g.7236  ORF Transcript_2414/g.7236 Transcript_2414/m.7236 type:complete len:268 (+) Transcript_2414:1846-2649(+)
MSACDRGARSESSDAQETNLHAMPVMHKRKDARQSNGQMVDSAELARQWRISGPAGATDMAAHSKCAKANDELMRKGTKTTGWCHGYSREATRALSDQHRRRQLAGVGGVGGARLQDHDVHCVQGRQIAAGSPGAALAGGHEHGHHLAPSAAAAQHTVTGHSPGEATGGGPGTRGRRKRLLTVKARYVFLRVGDGGCGASPAAAATLCGCGGVADGQQGQCPGLAPRPVLGSLQAVHVLLNPGGGECGASKGGGVEAQDLAAGGGRR